MVQIQPREHELSRAEHMGFTREHELGITDHATSGMYRSALNGLDLDARNGD